MAVTIDSAYIDTFEANVRHLAQQGVAKIRPHVTEEPLQGETHNFERLAASDAVTKSGRRVTTPNVEPAWSRRKLTAVTKHWADTIEHEDKVKMLADPQSAYSRNASMAMYRAYDDLIIAAATADATDGDGGAVVLPAGQQIGTAGNSTAGMTLDLITQVNYMFQANDVDPDERRVFVVDPLRVREMLNTDKLTSADYMAVQALNNNGMVPNFMGMTWVMSNRLTLTAGAGPSIANFAFTRHALGLAVGYDIMTRVSERDDLSYAIQLYLEWHAGATRIEDEHIVVVHFDQDYVAPA